MCDTNHDVLEIILTNNVDNLYQVSLTCKEWHNITAKVCFEMKMKYLLETSQSNYDALLFDLDKEMFRCSIAYHNDEYYFSWREYEDWEELWYSYRVYAFFYEDYMRKNHRLNKSVNISNLD